MVCIQLKFAQDIYFVFVPLQMLEKLKMSNEKALGEMETLTLKLKEV